MEVGSAMSVVQTLIAALQCVDLKEMCSSAGHKSQLEELQGTANVIKAVLEDAEKKQVLSNQEQLYIENLKDVLDEADNLFDEFVTQAERNKLSKHNNTKDRLFSVFSKYGLAIQMSQKAKKVKAKLDSIAYNKQFTFKHDPVPIHKICRETCSYEHEEIIGREDDLNVLMGMLLDSDVDRDVSLVSIVGIGGSGKTALAQLVYNDPRVESAFPLRMWTCVSDEDQKKLNVKDVLCRILGRNSNNEGCTLDQVQGQLRSRLKGQRYLLVLDDVWTESREQWGKLVGHLMEGQRGSWIVVTTRSQKTARLLEHGRVHKLQGLSQENSWRLFKRKAFGSEDSIQPEELMKIGQVIVEKCAYVPLAIRVVGSLLYGQSKRQWQLFKEFGLANINEEDDDIMPVLKMSYYQLPSPLKSCFSYCALFPKDKRIKKEKLIQLWMAQGYITSNGLISMEEVAEEYVLILIDRGFFQDVNIKKDIEVIESFKMHDLMHDVAEEVARKEICRVRSIDGDEHNKVRHISLVKSKDAKLSFAGKTQIRSFLQVRSWSRSQVVVTPNGVDALLQKCKFLRTLDLSKLDIKCLPASIGKLLHLRYLDVSNNMHLEVLPRKITRLYNLQVLKLKGCTSLTELPKDMSRLVKLRVLDITSCSKLTQMPRSIGELLCLRTLTDFEMREVSSSKELIDGMEDLKGLVNLKGELVLVIQLSRKGPEFEKETGREGGYLRNKENLDSVRFCLEAVVETTRLECLEATMEELQPHHNLKKLELQSYQGARMPRWAREDNLISFLPNLVTLVLSCCTNLKTLEYLGNLRHLKYLELLALINLEFLREKGSDSTTASSSNMTAISGTSSSSTTSRGFSLFPSLKELHLSNMPCLKGWVHDSDELRCLPQLEKLIITSCPSLAVVLQCPLLEHLQLNRFNNKLQIVTEKMMNNEDAKGKGKEANISKLRKVYISNVKWLKLLSLGLNRDKHMESLEDVFHICSYSLQILSIDNCENLTSVTGESEHLATLVIESCSNLRLSQKKEEGSAMPWSSLGHSLCTMELRNLPQLVSLPNQMQQLTTLQTLVLDDCKQLESFPNWMYKLTSLRKLEIYKCSATLEERCQNSTGLDRPLIAHIPSIYIAPHNMHVDLQMRLNVISDILLGQTNVEEGLAENLPSSWFSKELIDALKLLKSNI